MRRRRVSGAVTWTEIADDGLHAACVVAGLDAACTDAGRHKHKHVQTKTHKHTKKTRARTHSHMLLMHARTHKHQEYPAMTLSALGIVQAYPCHCQAVEAPRPPNTNPCQCLSDRNLPAWPRQTVSCPRACAAAEYPAPSRGLK
jgi:hypothetical protein